VAIVVVALVVAVDVGIVIVAVAIVADGVDALAVVVFVVCVRCLSSCSCFVGAHVILMLLLSSPLIQTSMLYLPLLCFRLEVIMWLRCLGILA